MNDIIIVFKSNMMSYLQGIVTIVSFIASILAIIGKTLPGLLVKPKNWKDRKAIRYSILNPINKTEKNSFKEISLIINLLEVLMPFLYLSAAIYICSYWIDYNSFRNSINGYFIILICLYSSVLCNIFYKTKYQNKRYRIPLVIIYVVLVDAFILKKAVEYCFPNNDKTLINSFIIICICSFIIIEFVFGWSRIDREHKSKWSKKINFLKALLNLVYMAFFCYCATSEELTRMADIASVIFFTLWTILCFIENKIQYGIKVEFKINKGDEFEVTQRAIYQYEYDKVKYILDNGCIIIIDDEEIQSIDYTVEDVIRRLKKEKVICTLKNNDVLNFDGYNFIRDLWVSFYKLNGSKREVKVINIKKVKNIVVEQI